MLRPLHSGWRYFPTRDAGVTSFHGVAIRSTDIKGDERLWTAVLSGRVSDWVCEAAYIRIDDRHHRIALHPSTAGGLLEVQFEIEGLDQLMQNAYWLRSAQVQAAARSSVEPDLWPDLPDLPRCGQRAVWLCCRRRQAFPHATGQRTAPQTVRPRPRFLLCLVERVRHDRVRCRGRFHMINLRDVSYCRLGTREARRSNRLRDGISLGSEVAERHKEAVYFKSDDRTHTLCYFEGDPADQVVAFEVAAAADLDQAGTELERLGHNVRRGTAQECELRKVRDMIFFRDPTGNPIELVVRPEYSGRRYFASRNAGITGFSHVGLCTTDPKRDERFWTCVCNARVSDRIGDVPPLRIHEVHHTIALFPTDLGWYPAHQSSGRERRPDPTLLSFPQRTAGRHRFWPRSAPDFKRQVPLFSRAGRHGVRILLGRPLDRR